MLLAHSFRRSSSVTVAHWKRRKENIHVFINAAACKLCASYIFTSSLEKSQFSCNTVIEFRGYIAHPSRSLWKRKNYVSKDFQHRQRSRSSKATQLELSVSSVHKTSGLFQNLSSQWRFRLEAFVAVSGQTVTCVYLSSNMHPAVTESSFSLALYLLCQHARVGLAFHSLRCCFMKQRQQISQCLHDFRGNPWVWRFYWSLRSGYSIHVLSDTSGRLGGFVHDKNAGKNDYSK